MARDYSEVIVKVGPSLQTADGGAILVLDASLSQTHSASANVTTYPVEEGADVTDHVQPIPPRITINGVIAAYPLAGGGYAGRELDGWQVLRTVLAEAQPVTVVTTIDTYENMVLASLSATREPGGASSVFPTIELQQVRIIARRTTLLPPETVKIKAQKPKAPGVQDVGRQATATPDAAQAAAANRSALKSLIGLFGGAP